jgi:hypothetical protein
MVSGAVEIEHLARTLRYAFALDGRIGLLREQASYGPRLLGSLSIAAELSGLLATRWEVRRAVHKLVAQEGRLALLVRPNLGEVNDWTTWRLADLIDILGTGVMASAVKKARADDLATPEASPYLDALAGEIAFRTGHTTEADRLATSALSGLPREEALLRWRTLAWHAEVLRSLGRADAAEAATLEVLQRWPTAFRLLELPLRVKLMTDGSAAAEETAARLGRSLRFSVEAETTLVLRVDAPASPGPVEICLLDSHGAQLSCAKGEDAQKALDAFHAAAFSPKVSLTESDLRSLDGSPVRVEADQALKEVLGR